MSEDVNSEESDDFFSSILGHRNGDSNSFSQDNASSVFKSKTLQFTTITSNLLENVGKFTSKALGSTSKDVFTTISQISNSITKDDDDDNSGDGNEEEKLQIRVY
jgi:hypothetical protein